MKTGRNGMTYEQTQLRTAETLDDLAYWFETCLLRGMEVIGAVPGAVPFTIYEAARLRRYEIEQGA